MRQTVSYRGGCLTSEVARHVADVDGGMGMTTQNPFGEDVTRVPYLVYDDEDIVEPPDDRDGDEDVDEGEDDDEDFGDEDDLDTVPGDEE